MRQGNEMCKILNRIRAVARPKSGAECWHVRGSLPVRSGEHFWVLIFFVLFVGALYCSYFSFCMKSACLLVLALIGFNLSLFAQWNEVTKPAASGAQSIIMFDSQKGLVATGDGIFRTGDGGNSWTIGSQFRKDVSNEEYLRNIWFNTMSNHHLVTLGPTTAVSGGWNVLNNNEIIIKTTDGGVTWKVVHFGLSPTDTEFGNGVFDIQFTSATIGYASSFNGRFLKTTDGGETWNAVPTLRTEDLHALYFINSTTGFVAGGKVILKTTDAGTSWTIMATQYELLSLHFFDANNGIATAASGEILRTANGGASWTTSARSNFLNLNRLVFTSATTGYAGGSEILKTTDGGLTWFKQTGFSSDVLTDIFFLNANQGYVTTYAGKVYKTSNGGEAVYPVPALTAFTPRQALPGAAVTLTGTNFSYVTEVLFNGIATSFTIQSDVSLEAIVPEGNASGKIQIRYKTGSSLSTETFTIILLPVINSFTPDYGKAGDNITVSGLNLGTATQVTFNNLPATFTVSGNDIQATVPAGLASGKIAVTTSYGLAESYGNFKKYEIPVVTSFEPKTGYRDANIFIKGKKFRDANAVSINGTNVTFTVVNDSTIRVTAMPGSVTSGKIAVYNMVASGISAADFIVKAGTSNPTITEFIPTSGQIGTTVTIKGKDFSTILGIWINGANLPYTFINDSTLTARISPYHTTGPLAVLDSRYVAHATANEFEVIEGFPVPVINQLQPGSGITGDDILITGDYFYNIEKVFFNDSLRSSYIDVISPTQLIAWVPLYAQTGSVNVVNRGGSGVSAQEFIVIKNYCVPNTKRIPPSALSLNKVAIGNLYQPTGNTCQTYADFTNLVIEATPGQELSFLLNASVCESSNSSDWEDLYSSLFIDWNNDLDFDDAGESVFISQANSRYAKKDIVGTFMVPAGMSVNSAVRVRVSAALSTGSDPCSFGNWGGAVRDYTLKFVSPLTTQPPQITALEPLDVTYGSAVTVTGSHFASVQHVLVDNLPAQFTYNAARAAVDFNVPAGTSTGRVQIITSGGFDFADIPLQITPAPVFYFSPEADTVGGVFRVEMISLLSSSSITNVYVNGTEAPFTNQGFVLNVTVPAGATHGKIALKNRFGTYESDKVFQVIRKPQITGLSAITGYMKDPVVILGHEFTKVDYVFFNGVPARFDVSSSERIVAYVPRGGSNGKISVMNKAGRAYSSQSFTIKEFETGPVFREIASFNYDTANSSQVKFFDYDNDGIMDIVQDNIIRNRIQESFAVYRGNGAGQFEETSVVLNGYYTEFGDADNDGDQDILCASIQRLTVYVNEGFGVFTKKVLSAVGEFREGAIRFVDVNHDGRQDIYVVTTREGAANHYVYYCTSTEPLTYQETKLPWPVVWPMKVTWADHDQDGDIDAFMSAGNYSYGNIKNVFYINNGSGVFTEVDAPIATIQYPNQAFVDLNGDSRSDFIGLYSAYSGSSLWLYNRTGALTMQKVENNIEATASVNLVTGDYNNDGKLDAIFRGRPWYNKNLNFYSFTGSIFELQNSYDIEFENLAIIRDPQIPSYNLVDIDNDTDLDLVMDVNDGYNMITNSTRIFKNYTVNNGAGKINNRPSPPTILQATRVSDTEVLLSWNKGNDVETNANSLTYNIRVKNEATGKFILYPDVAPNGKLTKISQGNAGLTYNWRVTGLSTSTMYSFEVQAIDHGYLTSVFSEKMNFQTSAPPRPTSLTAIAIGTSGVQVSWQHSMPSVTTFQLEFKKEGESLFTNAAVVNSKSIILDTLSCNTTYQFRVRAKDQLIYSLFSDAASATTLKMAKPIIQTPASRTGCAGDVITLTTSAEYTSYAWNSGQTTKSIAVTATGIFQVQVTDAFRCTSDYSDPVSVTILNYPVVDLIYDGTKITVKGEAQSYQWYLNEQLIPGATTTVLTPAQSGEYRLVAKNGTCETKSAPLQIVITGVENPLTDQIDIYPIPAFESLSVEMKESLRNAEVSLQLVSVNGSVLSNAIKEQGKLKTNLPTRHLPAGVYFLLIRSANYRLYKRVVISH